MSRNQLRYMFGALTITAMALLLVLAFGHNAGRVTESAVSADVAALQTENVQLNQTLQVMQQREVQYQAQIQQANDTIEQLVNDLDAAETRQADNSFFSDNAPLAPSSFLDNAQSALQNLFDDDSDDFTPNGSSESDAADQFVRPFDHTHERRHP